MGRTLGWLVLLGAVCWCAGCKMGQSTYDYTGPAFQDGYEPGDFYARRGSILGPGDPALALREISAADSQPTVAPLPQNPAGDAATSPSDAATPNP